MTINKYLRGLVYGFKREERGSIAVEAVVILPMMFWTYLALFSTFHSYRTYAVNQKAAYRIGDMVSRETNPINPAYLTGAQQMLMYLTNSTQGDAAIRITSVKYDAANNVYKRDWSEAKGYVGPATNTMVATWDDQLPVMPDNERVVVVETFTKYDPPFNTGLANREVRNFVFTKPRYAPQVLWSND